MSTTTVKCLNPNIFAALKASPNAKTEPNGLNAVLQVASRASALPKPDPAAAMGSVPAILLLPSPDPDAEPTIPNDALVVATRQQHAIRKEPAHGA